MRTTWAAGARLSGSIGAGAGTRLSASARADESAISVRAVESAARGGGDADSPGTWAVPGETDSVTANSPALSARNARRRKRCPGRDGLALELFVDAGDAN